MQFDQALPAVSEQGRVVRRSNGGLPRPCWAGLVLLVLLITGCNGKFQGQGTSAIVKLTDANFQSEVIESRQPVMVEFWAPWCAPCVEMMPAVDQVAKELSGRMKVGKLRIDENHEIPSIFDVHAPPAFLIFRDGKVVKRRLGRQSKNSLTELAEAALVDNDR